MWRCLIAAGAERIFGLCSRRRPGRFPLYEFEMSFCYRATGVLLGMVIFTATGLHAQDDPIALDTVRVAVASIASPEMGAATRAVEVITAREIRDLPVSTIPEVLEWALGVDMMPHSPALVDVGVRGSTFDQVLVMVDGVRVSDAQTGHFNLNLAIPLDQVERIEVLRGPGATLHGADAMGGVIHVVTNRGGGTRASLDAGSFGSVGVSASHSVVADGISLMAGGDIRRSDGHRPGTDLEMMQGRVALSAPLGARRLDLSLASAARDFGAKGFYGSNPEWDEYEETRTTTATLALRSAPDAVIALEPVLSFRRNSDEFLLRRDDPDFYRNTHRTDQYGGKLVARYAPTGMLRLAAGGEAFHHVLESVSLGDRSESHAALLAEAVLGRPADWTVGAGARIDWHEGQGQFISPSFSAAWWPVQDLRLRGSLGRALRTPTWTDRYYRDPANEGNADLAPESSWSSEVGVDWAAIPGMRVSASLYERRADDLIDWARPAGSEDVWVTHNVARARFRGVEASAETIDPLGTRWSLQGSWQSVHSSTPTGTESKYALRPLAESVTLGIDRKLPAGVHVALRALHARRIGEEAYLRADLRTTLQLGAVRVHADVQNLGDTTYLDITRTEAAGRQLRVGVEITS